MRKVCRDVRSRARHSLSSPVVALQWWETKWIKTGQLKQPTSYGNQGRLSRRNKEKKKGKKQRCEPTVTSSGGKRVRNHAMQAQIAYDETAKDRLLFS